MPSNSRSHHFLAAACLLASTASLNAAPGTLKIDINNAARNQAANTEAGYTMWSSIIPSGNPGTTASGTDPITQNFTTSTGENVTISFAQTALSASRGGTAIIANWYQVGVQNGTSRLVGDGIGAGPVADVAGGELEMKISGLSAGDHTLLTYHNAVDNPTTNVFGPIDIYVNGALAVDNLQQTIRAATNLDAATAYLQFSVTGPTDVVTILFSADPNPSVSPPTGVNLRRTPFINGFELNTSNATRIAVNPSPADADEHVDADSASITLAWGAAISGASTSRNVYFGTSFADVSAATTASPEFKGNQTALTYTATGINSLLTYYWRIDEVDANGAIKGSVWMFRPRQLAFPGAEGYGRFARGGRGGKVVHVTSLADYTTGQTPIPGTLRYAIEQETGPRTVVFDVSGIITLQSDIIISSAQPYITIAGQTAPGKGITIKRQQFGLSGANDVVVRFLRLLVGKESGETQNATGISGSNHVIMDHCSIGWGIDEGLSTRTAKNVTFQRCSLSEALNVAGHQNYGPGTAHGYAASVGGDIVSLHHNLLAHNEGRNWSMAGGLDGAGRYAGRLDIFNNVVYNWGGRTTDGGAQEVNFVNNYYKRGPANGITTLLNPQYGGFPGTQQYYMAGNILQNGATTVTNQTTLFSIGTENGGTLPQNSSPPYDALVNAPFFPSYATIHSAADAYKHVLSDVGCNLPQIDDRDIRIINEVLNGTYTYSGSVSGKRGLPDTTADVGGWENYPEMKRADNLDTDRDGLPDWWETLFGLNSRSAANDFTDSNADLDGDGYTNLDDYLNWLAIPRASCAVNGFVDIDLSPLSRGFTSVPVFTLGTPATGTVQLLPDGHTARYTPAASFEGIARLTFTVTDSTGSTMTRDIGVRTYPIPDPTLALTRNATTFSNEFIGVPGQTYKIQYSDDLVIWIDLQTVTGTGETYPFTVPSNMTAAPRRFFRAVSVP